MGEAQAQPVAIVVEKAKDEIVEKPITIDHKAQVSARLRWWLRITIFTIFVLVGQATAMLLGRLYFDKGGNSKWMATLSQIAGFPILIPFMFLFPKEELHRISDKPGLRTLISLYSFLGILVAGFCLLFTVGNEYLPVSTYSLICASQLAFNAFFAYFLNAQKFTPFIINSLVLITVSSALLVFQNGEDNSVKSSKRQYMIGFVCTIAASCAGGFSLSATQLAFEKVLKSTSFRVVFHLNIFVSLVATFVILIGLFASGEWKNIGGEMESYELGKTSYVMVLVWTAILWQLYSLGLVGLIFEVSSLFSNVIGTTGLVIVPVCAVIVFHDKMNGVKVISMLLAIWGFTSYIYQHYLDDLKVKIEAKIDREVPLAERSA